MSIPKKELLIFAGIIVLFLAVRLPGLHIPYHQDEYKWPLYSDSSVYSPGSVPHPPLTEFIYRVLSPRLGYDNFRVIPLAFSFINLFLLFYLVKNLFNAKTALWSTFLFAISFYSVLASLMVDVDGAVMPFFFLISAISYFKLKESNWNNWKWTSIFLIGAIGGFLIKVIFILPLAAFVLDFALEKEVFKDKKKLFKYIGGISASLVALGLLLLSIRFVFPFFDLSKAVKYWEHFAVFAGRGWFQTGIQFAKSILYTSPLLILPVFWVNKEIWRKTRPFFFFIFFGLFFYLFAFDFSIGALDRYFEFLIIPLCIIAGAVFAESNFIRNIRSEIFIVAVTLAIFSLQFFNHFVPSLYPKTEWVSRALSLKWNFLFPFTGGSGPTGFYISFAFMAIIWIVCLLLWRPKFIVGVLILGLVYNGVFIEEYLFGKINGSPYGLFAEAKEFIVNNPDIKEVVVYNDIGGYEIRETGKYWRRLYVAPQFESGFEDIFKDFHGHLLFIDIPRVDPKSIQSKYINSCKEIYGEKDKYLSSKIFDCRINMLNSN